MSGSVHPSASIGAGTTMGEGCVIGANVKVGTNCRLGHHVVIHDDTVVGDDVRIDDGANLGKKPMKAANSATTKDAELPPLTIGDVCIVGTGVVVYRGASIDGKVLMADLCTVRENVTVGRYCKLESESYICAYSTLEDRVFVAPGVVTSNDNFVGRTQERFKHFKGVTVKKGGRIGAGSVTLPGVVIGEDALVAAGSTVTKNVEPRTIVMGTPARPVRPVPVEQLLENQGWVDA